MPDKKSERYERLYLQAFELLTKCKDVTAQMATVTAILFNKMDTFFWCGFYKVEPDNLVVVTYQGPLACQLLPKNKGVCWATVNKNETIIVPDVHAFPGHIACDSRSKSEIVVPLKDKKGKIIAVLDVDSKELNTFDETDKKYLEKIVSLINI
ncbi:MAG: GAF domain-containing protein [Bacteroidales bacterium]|jgi:GAF domain-containing protein|nr:GAF domain-containing protein [Bacteroidales bacterium]MDD4214635.1 GAF domain-containing protein [Bacteroidales bacterium]